MDYICIPYVPSTVKLGLTWASEALNSFLRYFKKNSFKEDEGRKIRCDDMVNATPLESNKSLAAL